MTGGGPNANAAYLRALGLTSLGMQQQGEQNLSGAVARTPRTPLLDPASFFVTPGQLQEAQYGANVLGGAPIPSQAAEEARRNALAGINAGRGSVPNPPGFSYPNMSNFGGYGGSSFGSSALGITSSGLPQSAYDSWNQWMSGLGGGVGGGGGAPFGTVSTPGSSSFDPYAGLTGGASFDFSLANQIGQEGFNPVGQPPPGTISTGTESRFDPYADLTGGSSYDFSMFGGNP